MVMVKFSIHVYDGVNASDMCECLVCNEFNLRNDNMTFATVVIEIRFH